MTQARMDKRIQALRERGVEAREYSQIAAMFSAVYEYENNGPGYGIRIACHPEALLDGIPLDAESLEVDPGVARLFLRGLLAVLAGNAAEGKEELIRLQEALQTGPLPLAHLFRSCLRRDREAVTVVAERFGLPAALLEFVIEVPVRGALREFAARVPAEAGEVWEKLTCPVCSSPPAMAELAGEEGRKLLCCSTCAYTWPVKRLKCAHCGSEHSDDLYYFVVGGNVRIDACRSCSRYIKTRDSRLGNAETPLDVEDILTLHLDMAAAREGLAGYR